MGGKAMDCYLIIAFVFAIPIGRFSAKESHESFEDPIVERIMRERGLFSPHEIKWRYKPVGERHGKDEKVSNLNNEVQNLQEDLKQCKERNDGLLKELTENAIDSSLDSVRYDLPYLTQIYQSILEVWGESNGSTTAVKSLRFQLRNESVSVIKKCLDHKEHLENCMSVILRILKTGKEDIPSNFVDHVVNVLERVDFMKVSYAVIIVLSLMFSAHIAYSLMRSKHTILGMIFILVWAAFIVSIPWEWMHLYKEAISRNKAVKMSTHEDCFGNKMSYVSLMKYWLQDTFSFSDDQCLKYYNAETVDPIWEVTPGQALAASASHIILHPMLVMSEYIGKAFRLMFKEIPVQWQFPMFIAIFIVILLAIGVEVGGPLVQVGRGMQAIKAQLKAEQDKTKELREQVDQLNRRLAIARNEAGGGTANQQAIIKPQDALAGIAHPVDDDAEIVEVPGIENVPTHLTNTVLRPVEHSYASERRNNDTGLHEESRHEFSREQLAEISQATESTISK